MTKQKLSAIELHKKYVGKKATWDAQNGIKIGVKIVDVEVFYGQPYWMITPINGDGLARVRDHLTIVEEQK